MVCKRIASGAFSCYRLPMTDNDERYRITQELAAKLLGGEQAAAREKIREALLSIADKDTDIESGFSSDGMDFWLTIGGKEFYVNARHSHHEARQRDNDERGR